MNTHDFEFVCEYERDTESWLNSAFTESVKTGLGRVYKVFPPSYWCLKRACVKRLSIMAMTWQGAAYE